MKEREKQRTYELVIFFCIELYHVQEQKQSEKAKEVQEWKQRQADIEAKVTSQIQQAISSVSFALV